MDGSCVPRLCEPGDLRCADTRTAERCSDDGVRWVSAPCDASESCQTNTCVPDYRCEPGQPTCTPAGLAGTCTPEGDAVVDATPCQDPDAVCDEGVCVSLCERHARGVQLERSNLGCEFWSVLLEGSPVQAPAIAIVNPSDADISVTVRDSYARPAQTVAEANIAGVIVRSAIYDDHGGALGPLPTTLDDILVPPRGSAVFLLRRARPLGLDTSVRRGLVNAWQIVSSAPVAALQFGPWCCSSVTNADASLLLPRRDDALEHIVLAPANGYITVLGIEHNTQLLATPASVELRNPSIEAAPDLLGEIFTRLSSYDQLHLQPARSNEANAVDLTGTRLLSDQPVLVFAGHIESRVPVDTLATDHLEEQIPPPEGWATRYVVAPPPWRSADLLASQERVYYKLLAGNADVRVHFDPPMTELADAGPYTDSGVPDCADRLDAQGVLTLPAATHCEFGARQAFVAEGDAAFLIGAFLTGAASVSTNSTPSGDPSFFLWPGVENHLPAHHFIVPPTFDALYAVAVVPTSTDLLLDDQPAAPLTRDTIPRSGFDRVVIALQPGAHHLASSDQTLFGAVVVGYADFVSIAFPAGLRLTP